MKALKNNFIDLNPVDKKNNLPKPIDLKSNVHENETVNHLNEKLKIIQNKAWQVAISPASSIFMNFILFYFLGGSLNIYTLIMIFTIISGQIKSIIGVSEKFKEFEIYKIKELVFYKFIYTVINVALLGYSLMKLAGIGLLPLNPSDYFDVIPNALFETDRVEFN